MRIERPAKGAVWLAVILLAASHVLAAAEARIVQLRHRTAQEMIPLIQPLLDPGDALTGTDYRLIIRTSEANMRQIERLLAQLDIARRNLMITVRQGQSGESGDTAHAVSGEKRIGPHASVRIPDRAPPDAGGLTVEQGRTGNTVRYRTRQTTTRTSTNLSQMVRTLDGQRAHIRIGQSIPHVQRILVLTGREAVLSQGVMLQDITTGFDVLPRVQGDRVMLEITPRLSSLSDPATGTVTFQELTSTVTVGFGQWIDLGALSGSGSDVRRAILESGRSQSVDQGTIFLKIE